MNTLIDHNDAGRNPSLLSVSGIPMSFEALLADLTDIMTEGGKRAPREIQRANVKLLDVLGKGNFGEVRKGLLSEMPGVPGYLVAVKALHSAMDSDRSAALQEAVIMAQFNNAFVVGLHGVVTIGEPLLVVIEYCEHGLRFMPILHPVD